MIKTGIPTLDDYFKGGIPIGKTAIFISSPSVDGDIFGMQAAYTNLVNKGVCYYVTGKCSPDVVRSSFKEYGWDLTPHMSRFAIVDMYSSLVGAASCEPFNVKDPESIESIDTTMMAIVGSLSPGDLVIFSSLSTVFDRCILEVGASDYSEIIGYVKKWNKIAVLNGGVMVYNFTDTGYPAELLEELTNGLCNASLIIRVIGSGKGFGQYFKLHKCDWSKTPEFPTLFKVMKPGGIRAHIPKILVTGPMGAGKSTFVRACASLSSDKSISVDRMGTTVAVDYAHVSMKGFSIDLFGTPGQDRFNPIIKNIAKDSLGIIMVVDSTRSGTFERARSMLKDLNANNVPYIIAANKQDLEDALDVETIKKKMALPEDVPVMRVSATNNINISETLDVIINKITEVH